MSDASWPMAMLLLLVEFFRRLPHGLDETELLHIARGKGSVEVVNESYDGFASHNSANLIKKGTRPKECPFKAV